MLTEICAELKNYFSSEEDKIFGEFAITNGQIVPPITLEDNQFYRIIGSVFNDGVHQKEEELIDEGTFEGAVWKMRVPKAVLDLDVEILNWIDKNAEIINSPYTSESFGGYTYSKSINSENNKVAITWQNMFASRLNAFRRIRV